MINCFFFALNVSRGRVGLFLLGHRMEVGRVDLSGFTILDVLDAADEIVTLQLEVDW